jgi:dihydroorotate dehydrogenase
VMFEIISMSRKVIRMPDWSYHTIFRPILQKFPPTYSREFIHHGMSLVATTTLGEKLIEFLGHMSPSNKIQKHLFNKTFSTPVGLSGKIDPQLTGLKAFQNLGFGFIEIGPVSINGSVRPVALQVNSTMEPIWDMPATSIQLSTLKDRLDSLKRRKIPFFIKVEGTLQEMKHICEDLFDESTGFIINCHAFNSVAQFNQFRIQINKPIILSCQADEKIEFEKLRNFHPDGILLGASNSESLNKALIALKIIIPQNVPIITSGSIKEPSDAIRLLDNGASLIMLGFDYVITGPGLPKRINEAYCHRFSDELMVHKGWIWYWLFGLAITIAGIIALIFSMSSVILPYDESFLGILRKDIINFNPFVLSFMAHDRMTLSGTMISGGIIYMQLARHGVRCGMHWARRAINVGGMIGFLGILLFIGYGYFDWLHGLLWLTLLPLFILGFLKTRTATESPTSTNLSNHESWKLSLYGQLSFILLGASLAVGGMVISLVGVSSVFVPSDITYLCMSPEMLNEFNQRLVPVIAHDRAGFGSALFSVGLLVLMLALWGIREGERWVWWTFTIGAIPAFTAGIATHFIIGYIDFLHLLPAYFALLFYVVGVIFTAPFLLKRKK